MKKLLCLLLAAAAAVLLGSCGDNNSAEIDSSVFDYENHKNNCAANPGCSLAQIDGRVYYCNYGEDVSVFGRIENGKPVEIAKNNPTMGTDGDKPFVYNLKNIIGRQIFYSADSDGGYDAASGRMTEENDKFTPNPSDSFASLINDGKRYFWNMKSLYRLDGEDYTLIAEAGDLDSEYLSIDTNLFYLCEPYLYCQNQKDGKVNIIKYNTETKKIEEKEEAFKYSDVSEWALNLVAAGDNVYYSRKGGLYQLNLKSGAGECIFESDGTIVPLFHKGKFYISVTFAADDKNNGIYTLDLVSGKGDKIYDGEAAEIYMLDDEFVYFVGYGDSGSTLSRLNLLDKKVEELYYY